MNGKRERDPVSASDLEHGGARVELSTPPLVAYQILQDPSIDDDEAFEDAVEGGEEEARLPRRTLNEIKSSKTQPTSLGSLFKQIDPESKEWRKTGSCSSSSFVRSCDRSADGDGHTRLSGSSIAQSLFEHLDAEAQEPGDASVDASKPLSPEETERMLLALQLLESMSAPGPGSQLAPRHHGHASEAIPLPNPPAIPPPSDASDTVGDKGEAAAKGLRRFIPKASLFKRMFKSSSDKVPRARADAASDVTSISGDDGSFASTGLSSFGTPSNASAISGSGSSEGIAHAASPVAPTTRTTAQQQKPSNLSGQNRRAPTKRPNTVPIHFSGRKSGQRDYAGLQLCQSFVAHAGACWCVKLSVDGRYLATSGQDGVVHVWEVMRGFNQDTHYETRSKGNSNGAENTEALMEGAGDKISFPRGGVLGNGKIPVSKQGSDSRNEMERMEDEDADACEWSLAQIVDAAAPLQSFNDHASDVVDLSWSSTNFLLSASIDGSVHLYHVSKSDCLLICRHPDMVSSVAFHPIHDRFFITGCVDRKIRCWDVAPSLHLSSWAQTPDVISTVSYNASGSMAAAGLINGHVYLYKTEGMKYYTLLECRNTSGKYRKGSRVNSILFIEKSMGTSRLSFRLTKDGKTGTATPPPNESVASKVQRNWVGMRSNSGTNLENSQLLVTTNDSRIRIFKMSDFSLGSKFKGHTSFELPIRSAISEDGAFLISGSEDGYVYMWDCARMRVAHGLSSELGESDESTSRSLRMNSSNNFPKLQGTQRNAQYDCFLNEVFFSQGVDGALSGELVSGVSRPSVATTTQTGETETDAEGRQESMKEANTSSAAPVLCAVFGSSAMVRNALTTKQIEHMMHRQRSRGVLNLGGMYSEEGFPTVPATKSDSKQLRRESLRPKSNGSSGGAPPPTTSQEDRRIQRFVTDLSRRIIITADYNGVVRVYTHSF